MVASAPVAGAFSVSQDGEGYAARWDAGTRLVGGDDRSLTGGLSWAMEGGSFAAYHGLFTFSDGTTVSEFEDIVHDAFGAWTSYDAGTGSAAAFTFEMSERTATKSWYTGGDLLTGAEIDLVSHTIFPEQSGGYTYRRMFNAGEGGVTLTSGVTGHGGDAIVGVDIYMNSVHTWTGDSFRLVLAHELGIALGFQDVDVPENFALPPFFDDNYDSAFAAETLTNAWSGQIDVNDPESTPGMSTYAVANGVPGFDSPGADLLMETQLPVAFLGLENPLSQDEYAGRQFLYPVVPVPEPGVPLLVLGAAGGWLFRRRR